MNCKWFWGVVLLKQLRRNESETKRVLLMAAPLTERNDVLYSTRNCFVNVWTLNHAINYSGNREMCVHSYKLVLAFSHLLFRRVIFRNRYSISGHKFQFSFSNHCWHFLLIIYMTCTVSDTIYWHGKVTLLLQIMPPSPREYYVKASVD